MEVLKINSHPEVQAVFENYPAAIKPKIEHLRNLILETAREIVTIGELEETLKWGEPSYIAKKGSTIRIDYKKKNPDQYAMYFKCTSRLVPTFKEVFGDLFNYEKTRAIVFGLEDEVPEAALKACIASALQYHTIKQLPRLGM